MQSIYDACWKDRFEVIVVDNNSRDGSVDMIRRKYPQVKVIENPDNKLFAIANNQGAAIAQGDYILLLNSDTLVFDDNLQRMIDYFETLPSDVICIGPTILNPNRSVQSYGYPNMGYRERTIACFKLHKVIPEFVMEHLIRLKGVAYSPLRTREVGWVSGSCMMMRRHLYEHVGGLNEKILFYGEEPEFGYRTHKLGYRTLYYAGAKIIHLGGASTAVERKSVPIDEEIRLNRYAALIQQTVGYAKGIRMSLIVIFTAKLKLFISSNKMYFLEAIRYERQVVQYLKNKLHEENPD